MKHLENGVRSKSSFWIARRRSASVALLHFVWVRLIEPFHIGGSVPENMNVLMSVLIHIFFVAGLNSGVARKAASELRGAEALNDA